MKTVPEGRDGETGARGIGRDADGGNAAKDQTLTHAQTKKSEQELAEEIAGWFRAAEREDAAEDAEYEADRRGDDMPAWVVISNNG
jgi:hypothetical protein